MPFTEVKALCAELQRLHELAHAGRHGGTILTSYPQLVRNFADFHEHWDVLQDRWQARDRYQSTVRLHLGRLTRMGLLSTQVDVDLDGQERRTQIRLLDAPAVSDQEIADAQRQLRAWDERYGTQWNTGAPKRHVRDAVHNATPLTAGEIQRRGCEHTRAAAASRRRVHDNSNAPPFGTGATPQKNSSRRSHSNTLSASNRTRARTGASLRERRSREQRHQHGTEEGARGISRGYGRSPNVHQEGFGPLGRPSDDRFDPEVLLARIASRQAERAPVLAAIGAQARGRALDVATWTLAREWPALRLREAWVVARWGASTAAEGGPAAAGPLSADIYVRLRRAVARYERNRSAAPDGFPPTGLAALLHLGALTAAGDLPNGPRLLEYAVGRLHQIATRMRAHATANSARRHQQAARRAAARHAPQDPRPLTLNFRTNSAWPPWILQDGAISPAFSPTGEIILNQALADAGRIPDPSTTTYRLTLRDAYLLAGRVPPLSLDGRAEMAHRDLHPTLRPARPLPPSLIQLELRELAHHTREPISILATLTSEHRRALLADYRRCDQQRAQQEAQQLRIAIARFIGGTTPRFSSEEA